MKLVLPASGIQRRCSAMISDNPPATKQVKLSGLSLPLSIMLRSYNKRWASPWVKQHVFTGKTPAGCFINADDNLFISSPEFCFLQMANQLTFARLIELGYELCGTYSMPDARDLNVPERGFYLRPPLTSTKKLVAFMSRMQGVKGHRKAMRALHYLIDGSASPMETKISIILTLPYRLGGFGLTRPELNSRVVPGKTAKLSSGKTSYVCDLFWQDHDLAVEYDSAFFHEGRVQIDDDSKKRNALAAMGVMVITVTKQQLYSRAEFEKVARVIAKYLGKRLVFKNPGFAEVHGELRKQLL